MVRITLLHKVFTVSPLETSKWPVTSTTYKRYHHKIDKSYPSDTVSTSNTSYKHKHSTHTQAHHHCKKSFGKESKVYNSGMYFHESVQGSEILSSAAARLWNKLLLSIRLAKNIGSLQVQPSGRVQWAPWFLAESCNENHEHTSKIHANVKCGNLVTTRITCPLKLLAVVDSIYWLSCKSISWPPTDPGNLKMDDVNFTNLPLPSHLKKLTVRFSVFAPVTQHETWSTPNHNRVSP